MLSHNFEENHVLLLKCDEFMGVNLALDGVNEKVVTNTVHEAGEKDICRHRGVSAPNFAECEG